MNTKEQKLRKIIREELKLQLNEAKNDYTANYNGVKILIKGAHKWDDIMGGYEKAEAKWYKIYERLGKIGEDIAKMAQKPAEIIVKMK
jgi:hypothetical protein